MDNTIYIKSFASISSLGSSIKSVTESYAVNKSRIEVEVTGGQNQLIAALKPEANNDLDRFILANPNYKPLDRSVQLALFAASQLDIDKIDANCGVNISSSRGATELMEKYLREFDQKQTLSPLASPTTTLGNISSWISQHLQLDGIAMSHSITCSSALHSFANGIAWLKSGMAEQFVVGGSEAPLTPFTLAQMKSLKIYSEAMDSDYPSNPLYHAPKRNQMVLGEGASVFLLDKKKDGAIAKIDSIGYATEQISHAASLSPDADCLYKSMKMALENSSEEKVDMIIMHAPGTILGDQAELNAINKLFGKEKPFLYSNKYLCGHTFGASGAISVEAALLELTGATSLEIPYPISIQQNKPKEIKNIMINAVGFGANAVSIIIHDI